MKILPHEKKIIIIRTKPEKLMQKQKKLKIYFISVIFGEN